MMNKVLFGIDIGGTTVKCGLFTLNGELLEKSEIPTDKQDNGSRILSDVAAHIRNILEKRCLTVSDVAGVGIGVPGAGTHGGTPAETPDPQGHAGPHNPVPRCAASRERYGNRQSSA